MQEASVSGRVCERFEKAKGAVRLSGQFDYDLHALKK